MKTYAIHGNDGRSYQVKDNRIFDVDYESLIDIYKLTSLYLGIQYKIQKLENSQLIKLATVDGQIPWKLEYPYEHMQNTIDKLTEIISYKLGEDVLAIQDDVVKQAMAVPKAKRLFVGNLLSATNCDVEDLDTFIQMLEKYS